MSDFYGLNEFRAQLESAGWHTGRNHLHADGMNGCNWYAWTRGNDAMPDCTSNERAPSLCVYPYEASFDGKVHSGVTLELCGCAGTDDWLKLQVYTLDPATFFARLPMARARLVAAWTAAAGAAEAQLAAT